MASGSTRLAGGPRPWLAAALVLATLIAYAPALRGAFVWDDEAYVEDNALLRDAEGLRRIWLDPEAMPHHQYYPVVLTSFWLEYRLWSLEPTGYHVVNVLLHAGNALLIWRALALLGAPGAGLAAAVFALHPVQVESVAWITERKNLLSTLLYLCSLLAYLGFAARERGRASRASAYAASLLLFGLALLAKPVACTLPGALLLVLWWKGERLRRHLPWLAPFAALGAGVGLVAVWIESNPVGAEGMHWQLGSLERCLLAGRAFWFYLGKLLWPAPLSFVYPRWELAAAPAWQYLFPAAALAALLGLWLAQRRLGREPFVALAFFAGTLLPLLGLFNVYFWRYSFVADHFQYLASAGPIALAAGSARLCAARFRGRERRFAAVAGLALVVLGALTWRQAHVYADAETLWRDTLAKNPGAWMAHNNLGVILRDARRYEEALEHFQAADALTADDRGSRLNIAETLEALGRADEALAVLRGLRARQPRDWKVQQALGELLLRTGRDDEALAAFDAALEVIPLVRRSHLGRATALAALGRRAEAQQVYEWILSADPEDADAHNGLGDLLLASGRPEEALAHFDRAVAADPGARAPRVNRARALEEMGRVEAAIDAYEQELARDPSDPIVANNLGFLLVEREVDVERGLRLIEAALSRAPDQPDLLDSLAVAYYRVGRLEEARGLALRSLELDPSGRSAGEHRAHLEMIEAALASAP